jgi:capsular polysaccharide biosynthesis protein
VELNEAARRIFLQHWWLIAVGVIAGAAIGLVLAGTSSSYRASARMVIDTQDPVLTSQSTAIGDTVRAIATSPSLIREARAAARASAGEPVQLNANDVSVATLGTSGVLSLSVTANSKAAAAALANALANEVIQTRLHIANGQTQSAQAQLTDRIDSLTKQIAGLDTAVAQVTRQLVGASGAKQAALQTRLANLSQQRDLLTQQRGILQSEQASLISGTGDRPTPTVISAATAGRAQPTGASYGPMAVLGGLLGLVVALVLAALLEVIRPTLVGGESVARELGKPHLGTFSVDGSGQLGARNGADITYLLREAARQAHVAKIDLLGIGSNVDLALIAAALDSAVATRHGDGAEAAGAAQQPWSGRAFTIRPFGLREVAEGKGTGLAVIAPAILKKSELAEAMHFLRTTPWPLLGVMTYKPTRQHWWSAIFPTRNGTETANATETAGTNKEVLSGG